MSIIDRKIAAFTKIIAMLPDQPNAQAGLTPEQLKDWFDAASEELRVEFNGLIDDLMEPLGGEDIGFTGVGFVSTKLSAAVRELLALAQAAQAGTILPGTVTKAMLTAALQDEVTNDYTLERLSKDANDIFTDLRYKRQNGTLYCKSVLSGGTSPKYTTRTVTYYAADGTTVISTKVYTLTYTGDDLTSEVLQ